MREVREEMDLSLSEGDFTHIGTLIAEKNFLDERREGTIFVVAWREEFDRAFHVLEGAGSEWMTPDEMRSRVIYDGQRVHLAIFEEYLRHLHA